MINMKYSYKCCIDFLYLQLNLSECLFTYTSLIIKINIVVWVINQFVINIFEDIDRNLYPLLMKYHDIPWYFYWNSLENFELNN